jgi:hypothetical protein
MSDQPKPKDAPPKGVNPKTGKPYEPVKRSAWNKLLQKAARPKPQ